MRNAHTHLTVSGTYQYPQVVWCLPELVFYNVAEWIFEVSRLANVGISPHLPLYSLTLTRARSPNRRREEPAIYPSAPAMPVLQFFLAHKGAKFILST